jgi:hypothetical protein
MKKNEIKVGTTYRVKVSGNVQDVRITGENPHGGWDGVNLATNRKVRIKSAQRLRSMAAERPAKRKTIVSLAQYEAEAKAEGAKKGVAATVEAIDKGNPLGGPKGLAEGVTVPATGKPAAPHSGKKRQPKGDRPAKERKPSGLNAAATVLADASGPLNTKEIVERMLAKGLWQTGGKTPAATIYSAIIREIAAKAPASRFRKTERGKFELAK